MINIHDQEQLGEKQDLVTASHWEGKVETQVGVGAGTECC